MTGANQNAQEYRLTVTGGRVFPTTIVVTPATQIAFKNVDPFKHRVYVMSATGQKVFSADDIAPNGARTWSPPQGAGIYTVKDELFPSVRSYIVVDPQVVTVTYPYHDGAFGFSLPAGDYTLKAFFNGKTVGKPIQVTAKDKGVVELKEPFKLDDGLPAQVHRNDSLAHLVRHPRAVPGSRVLRRRARGRSVQPP